MKAVKAIYDKGKIKFSEKPKAAGPVEVLVVFPEPADDPWQPILSEHKPRATFEKFAEECQEEIRRGKSKPLRLDDL